MHFFSRSRTSNYQHFVWMIRNISPVWIKHFCTFLLYCYIHTRSLLAPCAFVSIESIDCILLSSFVLKAILLIYSAKTLLCFSLQNLCCVFNIILSFFMNPLKLSTLVLFVSKWPILFPFKQLLNTFYKLLI